MAFGRKRKKQAEEEVFEEDDVEEEMGAAGGAEFISERSLKPRSDVFTLVLILTFVAFLAGSIVAGREAWEHYDVQFFVFEKLPKTEQANQGDVSSDDEVYDDSESDPDEDLGPDEDPVDDPGDDPVDPDEP